MKRDVSLASIARKMGVSRACMTYVLNGEVKTYRLRKAIADALGVDVSDLWPLNGSGERS